MRIEERGFVTQTYPQPYRAASFRSGRQKEGPFMGRLRANFARLGNPMQDCHLRKEPALRSMLSGHWSEAAWCWVISRLRSK